MIAGVAQEVLHGLDPGPLEPVVTDSVEGVGGQAKGRQASAPMTDAGASNGPSAAGIFCVATAHTHAAAAGGSKEQSGGQQPPATHADTMATAQESDTMSRSPGGGRGARGRGKQHGQSVLPARGGKLTGQKNWKTKTMLCLGVICKLGVF
jgi:hypothetical protein